MNHQEHKERIPASTPLEHSLTHLHFKMVSITAKIVLLEALIRRAIIQRDELEWRS